MSDLKVKNAKTYTKEEKEDAVLLAREVGVKAASTQLGISHQNISRWKAQMELCGEVSDSAKGRPSYPAIIEKQADMIEKLRAECNRLMRRDQKWRELYDELVRRFVDAE